MSMEQTLHEIAKFHFILSEGRKGNHLLFNPETIRDAFTKNPEDLKKMFQEKLDEINNALNHTFQLSTFEEKRNYISSLPAEIQHAMIFGYFQLLEGSEDQEKIIH
ncbi:MAG TPA: hypothetical protein VI895_08650 [Bdellovibrionota bacterium]|nr:hypothetical protein [Bdellovibrionota bacterium]